MGQSAFLKRSKEGLGFGERFGIEFFFEKLPEGLVVLDGAGAVAVEGEEAHEVAVGVFVEGVALQAFLGVEDGVVEAACGAGGLGEAFEGLQVALAEGLAFFFAPVFVEVFEQVAGVEGGGGLEFFEGRAGAGALLEGFGVQPKGGFGVDLEGGAVGEEQVGVEAYVFEDAADAVDVLAEVAAGGGLGAARPELEGEAAAVYGLGAVEEEIGEEGAGGGRAKVKGLTVSGLDVEGFEERGAQAFHWVSIRGLGGDCKLSDLFNTD